MECALRQWKIKVLDKNKSNVLCNKEEASRLEDNHVYSLLKEEISFVVDASLFVVCVSSL